MSGFIQREPSGGKEARMQRAALAGQKALRGRKRKASGRPGAPAFLSPDRFGQFFALIACVIHCARDGEVMALEDRSSVMWSLGDCGCMTWPASAEAVAAYLEKRHAHDASGL